MAEMFRLAVVGAGRMGRTHMRALSNSDRVRVVAVVEPSDASRTALDGDVVVYPDVASLLHASNVDGVLVAAPSTLHLPTGDAACRRRVFLSYARSPAVSLLRRHARPPQLPPGTASSYRSLTGGVSSRHCSACGNASSRAIWVHCISWPATNGMANRRQPRFAPTVAASSSTWAYMNSTRSAG